MRALLLLFLLAACATGTDNLGTTQSVRVQERMPEGFAAWTDAPAPYRFGAGDRVKVQFLLTPEVNETSLVAPDGTISLRVAGRVETAGRTTAELERAVAAASRRILTNPIVTVGLDEAGSSVAFVGGQVRRSGAYPVTGRRGIAEVIAQAGGLEDAARMDQIVLIRRSPEDRPMLRVVNLQAFVSGADPTGDVPLMAGDIVFVPRNRLSEVGLWVDQAINRIIPFSRSFSYAINKNTPGNLF
ncbi:polysaccharide biosynthesis/export family protein [Pararoseomonas indoligenes]|uniref:Polysaccharide export protein n=1 Tax=Roseomonas indoligenes TaxID=2820811 RepID=A0A940S542_9PROT|nr:polysaccharide biosynthesis/export family protein [Pararoseomonas indoligenes]MBP0492629.1 polysaccharide export protein [Pararoseomonas indoligenes]